MKHIGKIALVFFMLFFCIFFIEWNVYQSTCIKNRKESEMILKEAYKFVNNESNAANTSDIPKEYKSENSNISQINQNSALIDIKKMINKDGLIGILVIPCLNIEAPIKDGTSQDVMRTSVGHFVESDYWNGNVSFASHNSGTSAHYFEKINNLKENDEIEYITKTGIRKYKVKEVKKIESTDWSMVLKSELNSGNTITLITCITGQPNYRLCVRGIEKT